MKKIILGMGMGLFLMVFSCEKECKCVREHKMNTYGVIIADTIVFEKVAKDCSSFNIDTSYTEPVRNDSIMGWVGGEITLKITCKE